MLISSSVFEVINYLHPASSRLFNHYFQLRSQIFFFQPRSLLLLVQYSAFFKYHALMNKAPIINNFNYRIIKNSILPSLSFTAIINMFTNLVIHLALGGTYPFFCSEEAPVSFQICNPSWADSTIYSHIDLVTAPNFPISQTGCGVISIAGQTFTLNQGTGACIIKATQTTLKLIQSGGKQIIIANYSKQDWVQLTYAPDGAFRVYNDKEVVYQKNMMLSWDKTDKKFGPLTLNNSGNILQNSKFKLYFNSRTGQLKLSDTADANNKIISAGGPNGTYSFKLFANGSFSVASGTSTQVYFNNFGGQVFPVYLQLTTDGYLQIVDRLNNIFYNENVCGIGKYFTSSCIAIACTSTCATCTNTSSTCASCVANAELVGSDCRCLKGYYRNGNTCTSCKPWCASCQSLSVCIQCKAGYKLNNFQCISLINFLPISNVGLKQVDARTMLFNFSSERNFKQSDNLFILLHYINGGQIFQKLPVLKHAKYGKYQAVYAPIVGNGTLCLYSNGLVDSTSGQVYFFEPLCQPVGNYGATPGTSLSSGYDKQSLFDPRFQFFNLACVISLTSIFIALYYYRRELVQLQVTFVYFIQLLYFIGLSKNNYITPLQNLLSGFAFSNLLFVPNFFAVISYALPSTTFSKNDLLLGGNSFIYNTGSSISAMMLLLVGFGVLFVFQKIDFFKDLKKLIFTESTLLRGKYILLFCLSLLEFNLFYFSILQLSNFSNSSTSTYYQRVNAGFAGICVAVCTITLFCYLAYNYYVNYHTTEQERFSFKIDRNWTIVPFAAIEGLRRLLYAILLGALYSSEARAVIIAVEVLYGVWVVFAAKHWKYKIWIGIHQVFAVAIIVLLLFEMFTMASVALIIIDSAVYLLFTWHYDPYDAEDTPSLKVIEIKQ